MGSSKPVFCKPPRYRKRKAGVMRWLVVKLEDTYIIEDDDGPWGAFVVVDVKPDQDGVPWEDFKWWLYVSYRWLNQVTRHFEFPMPWCDDAVEDIDTEAKYCITINLDSGYWQVVTEKEARVKLTFFTPDGKKIWKVEGCANGCSQLDLGFRHDDDKSPMAMAGSHRRMRH